MKQKLLLTAFAFLLSVCGAWADGAVIKTYLKMSDSQFSLTLWGDSNTKDLDANSFYMPANGGQVGWELTSPILTSDYDKLVVKLKSVSVDMELRLCENGKTENTTPLKQSTEEKTYEIKLDTLKEHLADNVEKKAITTINKVVFWSWPEATVVIDEISF